MNVFDLDQLHQNFETTMFYSKIELDGMRHTLSDRSSPGLSCDLLGYFRSWWWRRRWWATCCLSSCRWFSTGNFDRLRWPQLIKSVFPENVFAKNSLISIVKISKLKLEKKIYVKNIKFSKQKTQAFTIAASSWHLQFPISSEADMSQA